MRTLVLGGARSGKSSWAEDVLTGAHPGEVLNYIATARPWPGDTDFEARIAGHRQRREASEAQAGVSWHTIDSVDATEALGSTALLAGAGHVLLDDAGTWLTHAIDELGAWESPRGTVKPRVTALVRAVAGWPGCDNSGDAGERDLVIVTPEVGMSVIPEHYSGRLFRDELGLLNHQLADVCDRVVLVVAGCAVELKSALTSNV